MTNLTAAGKFFYQNADKYWLRGVTYGTFQPRDDSDYPAPEQVTEDFRMMHAAGINTVRVYTAPPKYVLDAAVQHGLKMIVGLAWSQHVCFLDDAKLTTQIRRQVRADVRRCADHPAVMAFAIGNEIPAPIVRWHGKEKIERFLRQLMKDVKRVAPRALVTYVNYPPTDYLDLSFLDFVCFNVFLHERDDFNSYLAKLQNIAGNRPLVLTEIGMDSLREGEQAQAAFLDWQLRAAFQGSVAGACVFAWTDDWYRGGNQIEDWAFGLVDAQRQPKPAYEAVRKRMAQLPFADDEQTAWPKVSVVICAYNAADTIEDCLSSLQRLRYPNYEVIVVNDGSRDATLEIAQRFPVHLITVPNGGLSAARNLGLQAATGEIVAYTDADVRVDEDWLSFLVQPFLTTDAVGVGGPNIVPPDDVWVAHCVAHSPGGPTHVLLNDTVAEHIPGCNMAFRKWALDEIGGFDPTYTKAGDDVDICWRLQARGGRLAFSPAALVWHHHRTSVKAYWRQQIGYGEGESFLAQRHPEKFNDRGQTRWQGRIYSALPAHRTLFKSVIYHGLWGHLSFPLMYHNQLNIIRSLPQMIEWQLATVALLLGATMNWRVLPLALFGLLATLWHCVSHALQTKLDALPAISSATSEKPKSRFDRFRYRLLIAWLHYVQPWARLRGRLKGYWNQKHLTAEGERLLQSAPWLSVTDTVRLLTRRYELRFWDMHYTSLEEFLCALRSRFQGTSGWVNCDDGWQQDYDLRVQAGHFSVLNIKTTAEDHGGMNRLFRVGLKLRSVWPLLLAAFVVVAICGTWFHSLLAHWWLPTLLIAGLMMLMVCYEISRRGGQAVAVIQAASEVLKLHAIATTRTQPRTKEMEAALEEQ
ncbi:MAG TPA: glycosyltransferase [Blastocatellia bacterium]|nr:glycosyltransferase [Blastocatellia bacterium]